MHRCFRASEPIQPELPLRTLFTCAALGLLLTAPALLLAQPGPRPWQDYHTIMWIADPVHGHPEKVGLFLQRLRQMGVNTAMVSDEADPSYLVKNHFPYYVENIINRGLCLKWNSNVRDWDKFVTQWARSGRPDSALVRDYCLDDPQWQDWARRQMQLVVRKNRSNSPLAYNIRDELSTTYSANPFDYDFNPLTLAAFRKWLRTQYSGLAALNAEWDTHFKTWNELKPFTTDQIKNRMASGEAIPQGNPDWHHVEALRFEPAQAARSPVRWNFAPWCDFRSYMDRSLARTLDRLRQAARQIDPATPVGIEGTQMPDAFGGYDLWRLSHALDWVEAYDIGDSRAIFGSFMPGKPILTTVFESDTRHAQRRLWHLLLEGDRGCIVWWSEDCIDWKSPDYALTPKAKALGSVLKEMTSPLARLFLRATPVHDPIYIHYSQPSIQVDWLLESTVDGSTWLRRFSSYEASHNRQVKVRDSWLKAFQDLGYSPQFISSQQLETGKLDQTGPVALVLPGSWALSDKEALAIRRLVGAAGKPQSTHLVLCDGTPGVFDEHGKLRSHSALAELYPPQGVGLSQCFTIPDRLRPATWEGDIAGYGSRRLKPQAAATKSGLLDWIASHLAGMKPEISLPSSARVRIHRFKCAQCELVAFERNVAYQMSEDLKQAGGNEGLEQPLKMDASLKQALHIYDLRSRTYAGFSDHLRFKLDPWRPALFALTPNKVSLDSILPP